MKIKQNVFLKHVLITLLIVVVQQLGQKMTLPSIQAEAARATLQHYNFFRFIAATTGGQFNVPTYFSIGLAPYMTGMILFQALKMLDIDRINNLTRRQESNIQRWIMTVIATLQAFQLVYTVRNELIVGPTVLGISVNYLGSVILLISGSLFVSWLADMNSQYGTGGLSFLILPGLITNIPQLLTQGQGLGTAGTTLVLPVLVWIAVVAIIFAYITIFMNKSELRIPIKRPFIQSNFEESYVPVKVLAAGSMPLMFATSVFIIPRYLIAYGASNEQVTFVEKYFSLDVWQGVTMYCVIVFLLGIAFSFMNLQPEQLAKTLKKNGDYIPDVFPGEATAQFLSRKLLRVSLIGNVFTTLVVGIPLILGLYFDNVSNLAFLLSNVIILVTISDNVFDQFRSMYSNQHYNLMRLKD